MAEYVASAPCIKLHMQISGAVKQKGFLPRKSNFGVVQRKFSYGCWNSMWSLGWKMHELTVPGNSKLRVSSWCRMSTLKCTCLGSMVNSEGATASTWVPVVDQVLLMASIYLTYMAGVIPIKQPYRKGGFSENKITESSTSSGSATTNEDQANPKYVLDVVKRKILDSLDAFERGPNFRNRILGYNEHHPKRPLNLSALADGPRLRLLWATFQQIEEEVNDISSSESLDMYNRLAVFSGVIGKCCQPVSMTWLEREHSLANTNLEVALVSLLRAKLNGDNTVLLNIKNSGKEDLYADLLCFLSFGSVREDCCYDKSLFFSNGISILEDLLINMADGMASIYLELISVDSNVSNEMNSLCLALCTLSTRALQRLRNEVALNQWLYQNLEAVASMYEDHFDLCTLQRQLIEEPTNSPTENSWWNRFIQKKSKTASPLCYVSISHFPMPVKRTKELRALTGWRYYFSLLLELSDIGMPFVRAVINKVTDAISFFLVCLIGRSLGLIYTGIRQSLKWK
ncbi:phosphoglycolate phosphatase [Parasponia andersonii]|uniref:Phosphoglycolate phosphatase n=1 Tax=Parasponia andersonii TaxID=3476 RepID=A0A2P5DBY9_PARAD|nr:phosphoglycolate phosphatase [Parasponia andersonii]